MSSEMLSCTRRVNILILNENDASTYPFNVVAVGCNYRSPRVTVVRCKIRRCQVHLSQDIRSIGNHATLYTLRQ